MTTFRRAWPILLLLLVSACDKTYILPTTPTAIGTIPTTPTNPTIPIDLATRVEFRVSGDSFLSPVVVRMSNTLDGLSQVVTVIPFSQTINVDKRDQLFLSLEARATGAGFLHAAIFVDGILFREAASTTLDPFVSVTGTWRR